MAISMQPPGMLALIGICSPKIFPSQNPTSENNVLVAAISDIASHSTSGTGMNNTPIDSASILVATARISIALNVNAV